MVIQAYIKQLHQHPTCRGEVPGQGRCYRHYGSLKYKTNGETVGHVLCKCITFHSSPFLISWPFQFDRGKGFSKHTLKILFIFRDCLAGSSLFSALRWIWKISQKLGNILYFRLTGRFLNCRPLLPSYQWELWADVTWWIFFGNCLQDLPRYFPPIAL